MKLDTPFKILDIHPDPDLINFNFDLITDWNDFLAKSLPQVFGQIYTFSVLRLDMKHWGDPANHLPEHIHSDHPVFPLLMRVVRQLENYYNATVKIAALDGMPPGSKINRHFDQSNIYGLCHRVHLPLVTDPSVKFFIDDVPHFFKAGEFFEFDNKRFHEVHNDSDIFRIHLVIDLLPNNL
jgi:hypothetical protein